MKAATGNAMLVNIIIIFLVAVMSLLVTSISYTKAFRVKNRIVDIISYHNGDFSDTSIKDDINASLKSIGYRYNNGNQCPTVQDLLNSNNLGGDSTSNVCQITNVSSEYLVCVYAVGVDPETCKPLQNKGDRGVYYKVISYMYFDIPIIGEYVNIPVYGETKVFYN